MADGSSGYIGSTGNNRYILVVQDYFTKWADARPIPDQTAVRITRELVHTGFVQVRVRAWKTGISGKTLMVTGKSGIVRKIDKSQGKLRK